MSQNKIVFPLDRAQRILAPRIGYLVTTVSTKGRVNAAPLSNVTSVSTDPQRLVLGVYKEWDTVRNLRSQREFVVNVPTIDLLDQVWTCGDKYAGNPIPYGVNELEIAGLTELPSVLVKPPRIAECLGHLECRVSWIRDVGDHYLVLGDILAASSSEGAFTGDWILDVSSQKPIMEIARNLFTFPAETKVADRTKVAKRVRGWLRDNSIIVPPSLKEYEEMRISEE